MQPLSEQYNRVLSNYARHPCSFLCLNKNNEYFTYPDCEGFIAYRYAGRRCIVVVGGVIAPQHKKRDLWHAFEVFADQVSRKIIMVHFLPEDIDLLNFEHYRVNQIGASYAVDLKDYQMQGKKFATLRNKISRARRKGVVILKINDEHEFDDLWRAQIADIDREWLKQKGKPELNFMIGELNVTALPNEKRLYLAVQDDLLLGYVQYSRTYGEMSGWFHDLSRRRRDIPIGTMEYLNLTALTSFQEQGDRFLHFGFTPFAGLQECYEFDNAASRWVSKLVRLLFEYGKAIYPAKSQLQYKSTWRPTVVIPEYIAIQGGYDLRSMFSFLKLVNAI